MKLIRSTVLIAALFVCLSANSQETKVSVSRFKDGKACASSFTFDDGTRDNYTIAAPELERLGWRGTFWLNCSKLQGEIHGKPNKMTWDDVCDLHARGHEVSNHGWEHKNLKNISYEEAVAEIHKNDSALFAHTGVMPTTFCYPYNAKNDEIVALASKGRVGTRTFQFSFGQRSNDEKSRTRIENAIKDGTWAVWMTHGITEGYDYFEDQSRFFSFLQYVKEREAHIWVATFREVAAYIAERDAVQLSEQKKGKNIYVVPSCDLDPSLYDMPLTMCVAGETRVRVWQDGHRLPVLTKDGNSYFDFNPYGGRIRVCLGR